MEIENSKTKTKGEGIAAHQKLGEGWVSHENAHAFLGEYRHKLDQKGRLALPMKFRDGLKGGVVITRGLDNCLFVYPQESWQKLAKRIAGLPLTQANARAFSRLMLAGAIDIVPDKQGRVVLPQYLRKFAALKSKVIVAGVYNRLEIWARNRWARYRKDAEARSTDIAENLNDLGI